MTVWRYTAVPLRGGRSGLRRGELSGDSAAGVRAALRAIGLQVTHLRPVRPQSRRGSAAWLSPAGDAWRRHLRARRQPRTGELYDSLATMLDAGVPLLDAVSSVIGGHGSRSSAMRAMLVDLREALRSGSSLAEAMRERPSWFDATETAMVNAGQHTGSLTAVLRTLAERHERSGELTGRLAGALAYPAVVALVGIGVVVFLSTKTLPELVAILTDAGVEAPALTAGVMTFGRWLVEFGPVALLALGVAGVLSLYATARVRAAPTWARAPVPRVARQAVVAETVLAISEMIRTGVPMVDSLRVLAPTVRGLGGAEFRGRLLAAADRIEQGESVSRALDDDRWFDEELRRLVEVGESSGDLPAVLERVGLRQRRAARRMIDRLATMLEPAVILLLALLVGIVVLAAVLPLARLQEVLG